MPTMDETRSRLTGGATREELIEEGHSASSISKAQKQLQKSHVGVANGHIPYANLTAGTLSAPAQKTEELAQEVKQAKLVQELSTLQGGGSELQQLRQEMTEIRQAMRDEQHRQEIARLEAKITAIEGQASNGVVHQTSAIEAMLQPFLVKLVERGLDPVDSGLKIDLGAGEGVGIELLTKLDDLVGRRQERTIRNQFFEKCYEHLPDFVEIGRKMASNIEAHANERGVEIGQEAHVRTMACPGCGVGISAPLTDEATRCPACSTMFETATLDIIAEETGFQVSQDGVAASGRISDFLDGGSNHE